MRHRVRAALLAVTMAVVAVVAATGAAPAVGDERQPPPGPISWLSTGDSYASGEGISRTGVGPDWCAQSLEAYGPRAARLLRDQEGWELGTTAFSACSGHLVGDWYHARTPGRGSLAQWTKELVTGSRTGGADPRFDVVTFSFGGNDVGFGPILVTCLLGGVLPTWDEVARGAPASGCPYERDELRERIDRMLAGHPTAAPGTTAHAYGPGDGEAGRMPLSQWYTHVANTHLEPGGLLVVTGYPRLFAPSKTWPAWRGDSCALLSGEDADLLGDAGAYLEESLAGAVDAAAAGLTDGLRIRFVSRLALFDAEPAHSLCGSGTSWLNGPSVGFWDGSGRLLHSFHPNAIGHQATAELVAGVVRDELSVSQEPPPEQTVVDAPATQDAAPQEPEPIRADGAHFDIGDAFDDECVVAWPTAPSYTSTEIVMTMRCTHQPEQFLFVRVHHGDPDLPITPSTGAVQVRGEIVDVSTSAYGFRQLVVDADEVVIG